MTFCEESSWKTSGGKVLMILESMSKELIIGENAELISRGGPCSQERENLLKLIEKKRRNELLL